MDSGVLGTAFRIGLIACLASAGMPSVPGPVAGNAGRFLGGRFLQAGGFLGPSTASAQAPPRESPSRESPPRGAMPVFGGGPAGSISPRLIARVFGGRNEAARLELIRRLALDPDARAAHVGLIVTATGQHLERTESIEPMPVSTPGLLRLLARTEAPETETFLLGLLDHPRLEIVMVTVDALGEFRRDSAIGPLTELFDQPSCDEHYGFRFNLVRALIRMRHPDAIEFLGDLEKRLDGQLRHELSKHLEEVTVNDFRGDAERYDRWRKRTGRGPSSPSNSSSQSIKLASESGSEEKIRLASSHYYGIPIHAKRLVFVIDCSGSMNKGTYAGTRIGYAKQELSRAIAALPSDAEFTILSFNEHVMPWRAELTVASDENKTKALRFVRRLRTSKSTNSYAALRDAMRIDGNLEAVFFLSDGRPNHGEVTAPAAIVEEIAHRNRYQNLVINTVGVAVAGPARVFMHQLATTNAGTFRVVD